MGNDEYRLESEALQDAWIHYKDFGELEARNRLILHYTFLVRAVASRISLKLPKQVDREDLISYGLFGLMDAIEKYDLDRNVKFETYAATRIQGSIYDEIRGLDWVPRTVRARARDIDRAESTLHADLGRPPLDSELAESLQVTLVELWSIQSQSQAASAVASYFDEHHDDPNAFGGYYHTKQDPASNPEDLFGATEVSELLAGAIDSLPQRFKTILVLYYLHEMTLAEIGKILGVTESRVCQLQSKLLQTLHVALLQGHAEAA